MTWEEFSLKVRRRETPLYAGLYRMGKALRAFEIPSMGPLSTILYYEREARISIWRHFWIVLYYQPMFRTRCVSVGKNLRIIGGIPQVAGNLKIYLGDNVVLHGVSTFSAGKVIDGPVLRLGNNVHVGHQAGIAVGREVRIGDNVLIGNRVNIYGYDLHPVDPGLRRDGKPPAEEDIKDVLINRDAWIGSNVIILKGVEIGEAAVIAAGSVVTESVPPLVVAAGNPAKIVKEIKLLQAGK